MRFNLIPVLFLLLLSCSTANTQASTSTPSVAGKLVLQNGINGDGVMTMSTPRGKRKIEFSIERSSETTATGRDKNGEFAISISGNNLNFSRQMSTRIGNITTSFEGKIESDNQLSGTMSMDSGPAAGKQLVWTAVRP